MEIVVICMAIGFLLWGIADTPYAPHKWSDWGSRNPVEPSVNRQEGSHEHR